MRTIGPVRHALIVVVLLVLSQHANGGDGCCAHCGCRAECHKVCRLVCEEKKVTVTCWGCKCEDFCVPGHSKAGCQHCEEVCVDSAADCEAPCTRAKKFVWTEWIPGCAKLHTKKKLMKKTVTKKVPSYKWVVEDLCGTCQAECDTAAIQPPPGGTHAGPGSVAATIDDAIQIAPASYMPATGEPWLKSLLPTWKK